MNDDLLYKRHMETSEHNLSPTELRMLRAIAAGNPDEVTPDFVAFQRLKSFGCITVDHRGRPTITDQGKERAHRAEMVPSLVVLEFA